LEEEREKKENAVGSTYRKTLKAQKDVVRKEAGSV
jgi:hypothetical protein